MALFSIQRVPGKGNGVIAASKITKGTRIHAESPFITLPKLDEAPNAKALNDAVLKQLRSASRGDQRAFFSLGNIHGKTLPIPLGIVQTNALAYGPGGEGGVFLMGSQFNHDCLPSARTKWNDHLHKMTVYALRDIEPGEEITITYINLETCDVRQKTLQDGFQFTCSCKACTLPEDICKEMDADIMEIKTIEGFLKSTTEPLEVCLRFAYRQRYLIESNALDFAHAPDTYELASTLAAIHKDYIRAKIFSERHLDIVTTEGGLDHPDTRKQRDMDDYLGSLLEQHHGPSVPYHFSVLGLEDWLWMQHLPEVKDLEEESSEDVESSDEAREVWSEDEDGDMPAFDVETLD
ncbi:uncharacterized protein PG986_002844 [Apiospora aurea]|uniref:SET domain-containing protein n=1 Tax=Apiospora aurea TaxID=335848 RepID=A0ABR1QPZ7_9PEZI